MRFTLDLSGDQALLTQLEQLPDRLERRVLREAVRDAAQPILARARTNISAIRVTGVATDPLRRGMRIRALRRRRGRVGVSVQTPTRQELGIAPSARWYYPAHIELGTRRTPALPYLRLALEQARGEASNILRERLVEWLRLLGQRG